MGHQPLVLGFRRTLWSSLLLAAGASALALPVEAAAPDLMAQAPAAPSVPPATPAAPNAPAPSGLEVWLENNKALATGMATVAALALVYGMVLGVKPRWLLFLPGKFKIPNTSWEVPLGLLLWLKYQPRVLDAWVVGHLVETRQRFTKLQTVQDRKIHIPIQIKLDGDLIDQLTPSHLSPLFSRSPATLLMVGEGGVGKTSFACQIARWGLGMADAGMATPPRPGPAQDAARAD